jgi:hypothetical protein
MAGIGDTGGTTTAFAGAVQIETSQAATTIAGVAAGFAALTGATLVRQISTAA